MNIESIIGILNQLEARLQKIALASYMSSTWRKVLEGELDSCVEHFVDEVQSRDMDLNPEEAGGVPLVDDNSCSNETDRVPIETSKDCELVDQPEGAPPFYSNDGKYSVSDSNLPVDKGESADSAYAFDRLNSTSSSCSAKSVDQANTYDVTCGHNVRSFLSDYTPFGNYKNTIIKLFTGLTLFEKFILENIPEKNKTFYHDMDTWQYPSDVLLKSHDFFDVEYYINQNEALLHSNYLSLLEHYLMHGWRHGLNPSIRFNGVHYLTLYQDVRSAGINPLIHYVLVGMSEGRSPVPSDDFSRYHDIITSSGLFDGSWYLDTYRDVSVSGLDPLAHYIMYGAIELRKPAAFFDPHFYLQFYSDVSNAGLDPFLHYCEHGRSEGRFPSYDANLAHKVEHAKSTGLFDEHYYLTMYPDVAAADIDPCAHYIQFGWREYRNPSELLHTRLLLDKIGVDTTESFGDPLTYIFENNNDELIPKRYFKTLPKITFVSHDASRTGAPILLLNIVEWFQKCTLYPVSVILIEGGEIAGQFQKIADTVVVSDLRRLGWDESKIEAYLSRHYLIDTSLLYLNTIVSANFASLFANFHGIKVCHIHELENIIRKCTCCEAVRDLDHFVDWFIAVSGEVLNNLVSSHHIPQGKISIISPGVKIETESIIRIECRTRLKEIGINENSFIVFGCGTQDERKGFDLFCATSAFVKSLGYHNIEFCWIGGSVDGSDYSSLHFRLPEGFDTIRCLGTVDNPRLFMQCGHAFFLSSREDPFPLVCLEAASCHLPVICFAGAGGMPHFVQTDAGFVLPFENIKAASSAVLTLFEDNSLREKIGEIACARVHQYHSIDAVCFQIIELVRSLLNSKPSVSVVVPVFNHDSFLRVRMDSILSQTIKDIEVIALDDCSTDNSKEILATYASDPRVKIFVNDFNSGSPFPQWCKGVALSSADFIWIAEGDDSSGHNFIESLIPFFDDDLVSLAYCKTMIIDESGANVPLALDSYLAKANTVDFSQSYIKYGLKEVSDSLGFMCNIVNASSVLFRASDLRRVVDLSVNFKMCGDWQVYLAIVLNRKICYLSQSLNFFRRHTLSVVHNIEGSCDYFAERATIAKYVCNHFQSSAPMVKKIIDEMKLECESFSSPDNVIELSRFLDEGELVVKKISSFKIAFYVHGMLFSRGGIERIASQVANRFSCAGHSIVIYCRVWGQSSPVYALDPSISVIPIFSEENIAESARLLTSSLLVEKPQVFIAMLSEWLFDPIVDVVTSLKIPIIVSEHNDPVAIERLWWSKESRVRCFTKAQAIHLLLSSFKQSLPASLQGLIEVIPNGVVCSHFKPSACSSRRIISVGRLCPQKRFDILIRAFSVALESAPGWTLDIYGEGDEREALTSLISSLKLEGIVQLRGSTSKIEQLYSNYSFFVLASDFEGFGIVVLEAMASGLPCVAFDSCNGPNELIVNNQNGLLASSSGRPVENLSHSISTLCNNKSLRSRLGARAYSDSQAYDISIVVDRWLSLVNSVVNQCNTSSLRSL